MFFIRVDESFTLQAIGKVLSNQRVEIRDCKEVLADLDAFRGKTFNFVQELQKFFTTIFFIQFFFLFRTKLILLVAGHINSAH